jgi:hypothetical protein
MKRKQARKAADPARFVAGIVKFILLILAVMFLGTTLPSIVWRSH